MPGAEAEPQSGDVFRDYVWTRTWQRVTDPDATNNLTGQKVATVEEGVRAVGTHTVYWDGRDDLGRELASGVYVYRIEAGTQVKARKLLLLL